MFKEIQLTIAVWRHHQVQKRNYLMLISEINILRSKVLKTHPALAMLWLGVSVMGSAGFGWSGDIDRFGGGDTDCCWIELPLALLTAVPNPETSKKVV